MNLLMVDLFSGLEGASAAMRERGWRVVSVDLLPHFRPSVVADVRRLPLREGLEPDLLWASPPCEEFARESMPWSKTGTPPSIELFAAAIEAVRLLKPRWWVIENVKGALPWTRPVLGPHAVRLGPVHLWGHLPPLLLAQPVQGWKERLSSTQHELRARIPYEVSSAVADAVEGALRNNIEDLHVAGLGAGTCRGTRTTTCCWRECHDTSPGRARKNE